MSGNVRENSVIVGFNEKTNIDVNKLEVCTQLIETIKAKGIKRSFIEDKGALNAYKRISQYVSSEGKKGSFKDDKIKDLAQVVGYQLNVSIEYNLDEIK